MSKKVFSTISLLLVLSPALAFAAGGSKASIGDLAWYFTNFTIYVVVLCYLLKDLFRDFWRTRREEIEEAVTKGEREMQAAKAALMEATEKVSSLTPEYLESVVSGIEQEAAVEAGLLVENAKQSAEQVNKHAEQSIAAERVKNETAVRNEIAELVIAKATDKIRGTYSEELDRGRREVAISGSASLVQ